MTSNQIDGHAVGAYLSSVTLVTVFLAGSSAVFVVLGGFEAATGYSLWTKVGHLALLSGIVFLVILMATSTIAALPSFAFIWTARRLRISHPLYYLMAGAAVGLFVGGSLSSLHLSWYTDPPDLPNATPLHAWLASAKSLCLLGALGGAKFWRSAGRNIAHLRTDNPSRPRP